MNSGWIWLVVACKEWQPAVLWFEGVVSRLSQKHILAVSRAGHYVRSVLVYTFRLKCASESTYRKHIPAPRDVTSVAAVTVVEPEVETGRWGAGATVCKLGMFETADFRVTALVACSCCRHRSVGHHASRGLPNDSERKADWGDAIRFYFPDGKVNFALQGSKINW